jgi:2-methylcitrate dehydratase PrpD
MKESSTSVSAVTAALADHVAGTLGRALPPEVVEKTKHHTLDTLAAMLSGSRLKPGLLAASYVEDLGGRPLATVAGTKIVTSPVNAALANGMMAHADETDDSHLGGRFHPGCGIVPAALAVAEASGSSGGDFLKAIALGYDIGARISMALGYSGAYTARHSTHSLGPAFGAVAAAAALLRLDQRQVRHSLSFAVQQASGVPFWQRDEEHIEKAFDFGGMGARNGVAAATMVAAGFTAVEDPLAGRHNLFTAFAETARPETLVEGLGTRHEILEASIKKWCVGSPIQAALDSLTALMAEHGLRAADVARLVATMPDDRIHIVDNRPMPDICLQHLLALTLVDGGLTFASSHNYDRMSDPAVLDLRRRIETVPSAELTAAVPARQAIIEIETRSGGRLTHRTRAVRGTPDNPMERADVAAKATDLIQPVIGPARTAALIDGIWNLERVDDVRALRSLLTA